jgi:hypothetical protein
LLENIAKVGVEKSYKIAADNSLLRVIATFPKNPIEVYDEAIVKIDIKPLITFPFPIKSIEVMFDKSSLNKLLAKDLNMNEGVDINLEASLYIEPEIVDAIELKGILISLDIGG